MGSSWKPRAPSWGRGPSERGTWHHAIRQFQLSVCTQRSGSRDLQRHLHIHVHSRIGHNSQAVGPTQVSISGWTACLRRPREECSGLKRKGLLACGGTSRTPCLVTWARQTPKDKCSRIPPSEGPTVIKVTRNLYKKHPHLLSRSCRGSAWVSFSFFCFLIYFFK